MILDSCWPTGSERSLLRAALLEAPAARVAFDEWMRGVRLDDVHPAVQELLPLVANNLSGVPLPPEVAARISGLRRRTWLANQLHGAQMGAVLAVLNERGIPALVFKGFPLAHLAYPSPSTRAMSDVDLWVPPAATGEVVEVLAHAGYRPRPGLSAWPPAAQPAWPFEDELGGCIDLHAHVLGDALYPAADAAIMERAVSVELCGARALVPDPADHLLILLSHGLRWNPVPPLRWAADAVVLMRSSAGIDWDRLVDLASRLKLSAVAQAGLTWLRDHLEADLPPQVLNALGRSAGLAERLELRVRKAPPDGILGAVPQMFSGYARSARGGRGWITPVGFLRYLAAAWGVGGPIDLLQTMIAKAQRRVRSVLGSATPTRGA